METTKLIELTIDGQKVQAEAGSTILDAAKKAGIKIPTLCYHPDLTREGGCRVCVVEVEGARNLVASCVYPAADGMVVRTNSDKVRTTRRTIVELLVASHNRDCLTCARNGNCELQDLARDCGVRESRFDGAKREVCIDDTSASLVRNTGKCILCGRCVRLCREVQGVSALGHANRGFKTTVTVPFDRGLGNVACSNCGQCATVCPVAAIDEKPEVEPVWAALNNPDKHVVVQVAPAVRAALGEELGMRPGSLVTGQMVTALRRLGFDKVFDTTFAADVTIMEEGYELLDRLEKGGALPLITSCSPGWVKFCEHFYPEFLPNLSTAKSPQQIFGALAKSYYAEKAGIDSKSIFCVSVMPCTAKKFEADRPEMAADGVPDVDAVITTRELAHMIKEARLDFAALPESQFDLPMGMSTGAGVIFGVTGGVMEAALRTLIALKGGEVPENLALKQVRGLEGIKEASVAIGGSEIKVAVANGLGNARKLLEKIKKGEANYAFVEVMGCPGGCITGGGQPRSSNPDIKTLRANALYRSDETSRVRMSHENPAVKWLYKEYLGSPLSKKAHHLLHTTYTDRKTKLD